MTTVNDALIRAFLADEARRAVAAAPSLEEAVGRLAPRIGGRPSGASQRLIVLLAATMLLVAALGTAIAVGSGILPLPLVIESSTVSPFEGTWVSTSDTDGGTQTMTVRVSAEGAVEITVLDDVATVCSRSPSTMRGTGRLQGGSELVIPSPAYTCDDGSEPEALSGPPLQEQLLDLTFTYDAESGTLTDNFGAVWHREGAEDPSPDLTVTIPDTMWPQSSLEEVQEAQRLADAGDPDYTWQVDAQLAAEDYDGTWDRLYNGEVELVDRFLREVLGWEAYMQNVYLGGADHSLTDQRFLRCAPGRTNPLYPPQPGSQDRGESCAPTIDDLTYESVSLDLVQPDRQGPGGIWAVSRWSLTAPFEQADPTVAEAQATARLEAFLAARIAGRGAEGYVDVYADWLEREVPLLYATSSGAPYERFEFERVDGPNWPYGGYITFSIRLFADDGATVVEQEIYSHWDGGRSAGIEGGLALGLTPTTENGQPVAMLFAQFDGDVTYSSPSQNRMHVGDDGRDFTGLLDFTDPAVFWSDCAQGPVPADADAFAQAIIADPNFETTAPVAARVGGVEAVAIDVALSPGGRVCLAYRTDAQRWIHALEPGKRLRLFLVDLPEGMSMRTLAVTIVAPDERFEEVLEEAEPIIDSIEFHPG
ncbi:MAG: hypothetical protein H0U86_09175 [Chloroflexi bacterium]|nr:hypothetical protein [Chloroflexota bacterium]